MTMPTDGVDRIETSDGELWAVDERTRTGRPLRVHHERLRGSFREACLNNALAWHALKVELRDAVPMFVRKFIPPPEAFWREV